MVLAREWTIGEAPRIAGLAMVHDRASDVEAEGSVVHLHGPSNVDLLLTPKAALEASRRIANAATEVLIANAALPSRQQVVPV